MFGHGFPNSLQAQGQPSQFAINAGINGAAGSAPNHGGGMMGAGAGMAGVGQGGQGNGGFDLQQIMAMSGLTGGNLNAFGNGGSAAQATAAGGMPMALANGQVGNPSQQQQQQPGQGNGNGSGGMSQEAALAAMANANPQMMFNPQLQAFLQQQMQQQQQQRQSQTPQPGQPSSSSNAVQGMGFPQAMHQQFGQQAGQQGSNSPATQQQQQQGMRWPGQGGVNRMQQPQQQVGQPANMPQFFAGQQGQPNTNPGQMNQHAFNPFAVHQSQQQAAQQQQQQGGSSLPPNFITPNMLGQLQQNQILANSQMQSQQQPQQNSNAGSMQGGNAYMDPAALMAAAAQASGGMIDPNVLLQNAGLLAQLQGMGAGLGGNGVLNGNALQAMQAMQQQQQQGTPISRPAVPASGPMRAPTPAGSTPKPAHQSPKSRPNTSVGTPESRAKSRPKPSAKKKKDEDEQQQRQQTPQLQAPSQAQGHAPQFPVPMQSHANPPMASPVQAFAHQEERARSQTRSPSVSGASQRPPFGAPSTLPNGVRQSVPPGWAPSLTPQQQQQLLQQALNFSKAQSARGGGSAQPTPSPAQTLMQMGYVYVKSNVLPNNGFGAGIPGNGPSGAGAVLSIEEAKMIGTFGPQQQHVMGQMQSQPPQHAQMQNVNMAQQRPPFSQQQQGSLPGTPVQAAQSVSANQSQVGTAAMHLPGQHAMGAASGSQGVRHPQPPTPSQQQQHLRSASIGAASGSPIPGQISSTPPAAAASSSPAGKPANRKRQMSSSRPLSSAGRAHHEAQMAAASYASYAQPAQSGAPLPGVNPAGSRSQPPFANSLPGTGQSSFPLPQPSVSLPPVHGGPLPRKTRLGFDIVPEYNARITPLPSSEALSPGGKHRPLERMWKPLTKEEEKDMIDVMRKDSEYTKLINGYANRTQGELVRRINDLRPVGSLHWWERGADEDQRLFGKDGAFENFKIILPADKRTQKATLGLRSALGGSTTSRQLRLERKAAAQLDENLVPIRLEIDHEGWKLRDTFTWPAPESYKGDLLERFASTLCEDFGLPHVHFVQAIRESIINQVQDHTSAEAIRPTILSKRKRDEAKGRGRVDEKAAQWWQRWRRDIERREEGQGSIREIEEVEDDGKDSTDAALDADVSEEVIDDLTDDQRPDMRIQIKLDITVGAMNLIDQFEWDVNDEGSSAEGFATAFAADLGLSGEFRTAIAHSIREQVDVYIRSLSLMGYAFDGTDVLDEELRSALLAPVSSIVRLESDIDLHTPKLMQLSELEIMQLEKEREREARRKRRQTRGRRGVNLPDREPLKTARTPAIHGLQQNNMAGSVDGLGASGSADVSTGRGSDFGTSTRSSALGGMSTRRAAAVVASANIASATAAGDYGTPTPQPEEVRHANAHTSQSESAKRRRLESHATHFEYPGGLGKIDDDDHDDDEERDRGPKFAPVSSDALLGDQKATGESDAAGMATGSAARASRHGLSGMTGTSSAPVAWNMARPEEALNQVSNWHDGMWYCSNCGVPGTMDPSRRKGPLGDKSLCGMCGKYFHRHRKARPVDYTRSVLHHLKQLQSRGITPSMVEVEELLSRQRATDSRKHEAADRTGSDNHGLGQAAVDDSAVTIAKSESSAAVAQGDLGVTAPATETASAPQSAPVHSAFEHGPAGDGLATTTADSMMTTSSTTDAHPASNPMPASAAVAPPRLAPDAQQPSLPLAASSTTSDDATVKEAQQPMDAAPSASEEKATTSFPTTRGNSPELPFEQVGSPDDSDSSDDDQGPRTAAAASASADAASPSKGLQRLPSQGPSQSATSMLGRSESPFKGASTLPSTIAPAGTQSATPAAADGSPAPPASSALTATAAGSPPDWLQEASAALRTKYPLDRFEVLVRPRPPGTPAPAVTEWRLRCQDCPGKLYTPGPGETLTNFEIHLRNRAHRTNVQKAAQVDGRKAHV